MLTDDESTDEIIESNQNNVSTEGISEEELYQLGNKNLNLEKCSFCAKYYEYDMIAQIPNNDKQCWHCLFWMNYAIPTRSLVDGVYGMTIVEYILKCKDVHEIKYCVKNSDSGGCFLCEYLLGVPLSDVKDLCRLKKEIPENPKYNSEDDIFNDQYEPGEITVQI